MVHLCYKDKLVVVRIVWHTFRKRVKNVVTSKGIQVGIECK